MRACVMKVLLDIQATLIFLYSWSCCVNLYLSISVGTDSE